MSTVVVAPDSFKGSASATEIATALAEGWLAELPGDRILLAPMADGGEGTLDAFEVAVPGSVRHRVPVSGPVGEPVDASWLMLPHGTALVELADASGLGRLTRLAPHDAHTTGFGQAIAAALDAGATRLLLGLGGSASTDGGAGALTALGARLLDTDGRPVALGNRGLRTLACIEWDGLRPLPPGGVRILSDVTSPLLGPMGAAAVFGPQKGASADDVPVLEAGLARFAAVVSGAGPAARTVDPAASGTGAAGGAGFGLLAWGATISAGAAAVGDAIGLPALVASADAVLTGEGRFDAQSAAGKVPEYVSALAAAAGVPAYLAAGSIAADPRAFAAAADLSALAGSVPAAIADASRYAREAGAALAAAHRRSTQ